MFRSSAHIQVDAVAPSTSVCTVQTGGGTVVVTYPFTFEGGH